MSRYIRNEILNQPEDFVNFMMQDFLSKHGFEYVQFKGQMVYRAGGGFVELPKFFTWNYQNGVMHIEAWIRVLWLPGVYGKENDMTGFYGGMVKDIYKKDVEQLIALLHQPLNQQPYIQQPYGQPGVQQNGMPQNQPGMQTNGMPQNQPTMVYGVDTSRYANMALGFGIVGLLLCWSFYGIIVDAIALIYGIKGQKSAKKGRATAGLVCAIISLVVMMCIFFGSIVVGILN
jgi:hypothetical protein